MFLNDFLCAQLTVDLRYSLISRFNRSINIRNMLLEIFIIQQVIFGKIVEGACRFFQVIDYEMYAEEGKHLKEMLYDLVDFDATAEKRRIQEKLLNNDMNLCLLEIMRDSLIALRDYPKNGQLYYRLLKYRYFEAGNTNEDVMLMLDDMPSTTYYRNRKKAIRLYATMLWAFTRPEKIQNKMEEINWKKSGSKVAVN